MRSVEEAGGAAVRPEHAAADRLRGQPAEDMSSGRRVADAAGRGGTDRVFGVLAGIMIAIALYLLINSLVGSEAVVDGPPQVELLSPSAGDSVGVPFTIRLRSERPLSIQPGGWGVSGYHIHAEIGGVELMPGPGDIRPIEGGEYLWVIPAAASGSTTVRLFWADASHRAVSDGASEGVDVFVRQGLGDIRSSDVE